jgi:glycosyltransferase involved in cell wall biosynthesis
MTQRPFFSICIPAYNRARHLRPLLDSLFSQNFDSFEIVICEDVSRERPLIAEISSEYSLRYPGKLVYLENPVNLGYDANIRNLVSHARGEFCFFMGNDDLMCPGALAHVHELIGRQPDIGLVLKSYSWFDATPDAVNQTIRYFTEETLLSAGAEAIGFCFRRAGVISGYIVHRDLAHACATTEFDGSLYYQMHLTASVLLKKNAVSTPMVLVLCRNGEPPEFGNSGSEKGKYTPGVYTPQARLNMVGGAIGIIRSLAEKTGVDLVGVVTKDYANYFYPYIKDQLNLPLREYLKLYRCFSEMGFGKYPLFHFYFVVCYILGERRFDAFTRWIRNALGRSPHFGVAKR